ncbi:MAG: DUF3575 domain-containing protein [Cyclobacteriaceae bacterium]
MKKIFLSKGYFVALFFAFLLFGVGRVNAQNTLKINILSPIVKTINLQYEKVISTSSSVQLGFFYTGYSTGGTSFSGFGLTPEYRFYLSDTEAPAGVYVAPFIRYQSFNLKEDDISNSEADFTSFGGGLILGKQWVFKEKVVLDIFLGPAYSSGNVKVKSGTDNFDTGAFDGFGLRTGVCFGLVF